MADSGDGSQQGDPLGFQGPKDQAFRMHRLIEKDKEPAPSEPSAWRPTLPPFPDHGNSMRGLIDEIKKGYLADREVRHRLVANATTNNFCKKARVSRRDLDLRRLAHPRPLPRQRRRGTRNHLALPRRHLHRHLLVHVTLILILLMNEPAPGWRTKV